MQFLHRPSLASLRRVGVSAIDDPITGIVLATDGSELEGEPAPEPRLFFVRVAVSAICHVSPGYFAHYFAMFEVAGLWIFD